MRNRGPDLPFNPFVDVAVGNPWRSAEPDVRSINSKAYEGLLRLLGQLKITPHLAALVLGSAGSGKTHLIKRLIQSHDVEVVFVYVHPIKDHNRIFTSLMEQVSTNLTTRPHWLSEDARLTQLDLIIAHVMAAAFEDYLRQHPDDPGRIFLKTIRRSPLKIFSFCGAPRWTDIVAHAEKFLADRVSLHGLPSPRIVRAMFQYLDKMKREAVRTFLGGTIPDEDECNALGLRFSVGDWSLEAQEQRSKDVLKTVGVLLEFYGPMVLCFDQLDSLESPELVRGIGTLFMDIINETENILPIGFARPENWENRFKKNLDSAAAHRMEAQILPLQGCSLEQALELIRERLAWAYSTVPTNPPDAFFPFDRATLELRLKGVTSPREVLSTANRLFSGPKPAHSLENPIGVIRKSFEAEQEKLLAMAEPEPTRQDSVTTALRLYFENRMDGHGYRIAAIDASGADIKLCVNPNDKKFKPRIVLIRAETAQHWQPLGRSLESLKRLLEEGSADFAFFIRDDRHPIPPKKGTMPKTVRKLNQFERAGGYTIYMDYPSLSALYALAFTGDKVGSGDLSYVADEDGERREVDREAFLSFVREEFTCDALTKIESRFLGKAPRRKKRASHVGSESRKEPCDIDSMTNILPGLAQT